MITRVDAWFSVDQTVMTWVVDGMLETTVSRIELYEAGDYVTLLRDKLMPLAFLCLPTHDDFEEKPYASRHAVRPDLALS